MAATFLTTSHWALVTGANRGIGLDITILLARKGKRVLAGVRTSRAGIETVAAVRDAVPGAVVEYVLLDTSSSDSIKAAVKDIAKRHGRTVDVLINNAGIMVLGWDAVGLENTLRTNVDGPVLLARALAKHLAPLQATDSSLTRAAAKRGSATVNWLKRARWWTRARQGDKAVSASSAAAATASTGSAAAATTAAPLEAGALVVMVSSFLGQRHRQDPRYVRDLLAASSVEEVRRVAGDWRESEAQAALPWSGSYHLTKCALNRDVELLARDEQLRRARVAVVAADPGWCRTDMGSQDAPRSSLEGAESVARWLQHYQPRFNGGFFRDEAQLAW